MKQPAKKRFGQHFLTDPWVLSQIINAAMIQAGEPVLEIGPGKGVLTEALLKAEAQVSAVEIDRDLAAELKKRFAMRPEFNLIQADILRLDWGSLFGHSNVKLVANLPYNISTELFFKILKHRDRFASITVMVQKEVGDRLLHQGEKKPLKDYGILSVAASLCFKVKTVCAVAPSSFSPPPKVDSLVVQMLPKKGLNINEEKLMSFVRWGFGQRRKLLLSRFKRDRPDEYLRLPEEALDLMAGLRPENLKPSDWLELYHAIERHSVERTTP